MADLFDYLNWRGDLSFEKVPFNKIDALLLAHVTYSIFDGIVPESFSERKTFAQVARDFSASPDYEERIYSRVMANSGVIHACEDLGIRGRHIIGMYGPFSKEMNCAMIKDFDIRYLVTKDYGISTGFIEKMEAALEMDATLIVVASNYTEHPGSEDDVVKQIRDEMNG